MGRCRFVEPQLVRLPLSDDDWIDVKRELTIGEQREMFAAMRRQFTPGEMPVIDDTQIGQARALGYIVAWSFMDRQGKPVPFSHDALMSLDTATGREIRDALERHEANVNAEREAQKKMKPGPSKSDQTLRSVS